MNRNEIINVTKGIKLKELKKGEYFTKKPVMYPNESQVFVKDSYDRTEKKYECYRFSDINDYQFINGDKIVYTYFTF